MRKRLILHIGSSKTGTTALQCCMMDNEQFFMKNRICFTNICRATGQHLNVLNSLIKEYCDKNNISDTYTHVTSYIDPLLGHHDKIINDIKDIAEKENLDTIIISSEIFFQFPMQICLHCAKPQHFITGLRSYVMEYFKETFKDFDIKIVCYLRRQDDYIESMYNQVGRNLEREGIGYDVILSDTLNVMPCSDKYLVSAEECLNAVLARYINYCLDIDYYKIISAWADVFGKENIIIRPYEKDQLPNGTEYDFFTNVLGMSEESLAELNLNRQINTTFFKDLIEYKISAKQFNILHDDFGILNRMLSEMPQKSAYFLDNNKKNILSAKLAGKILDYYSDSNEKIAREYLHREDGILFYAKRREEKDDYPGLSEQAVADISCLLARVTCQEVQI